MHISFFFLIIIMAMSVMLLSGCDDHAAPSLPTYEQDPHAAEKTVILKPVRTGVVAANAVTGDPDVEVNCASCHSNRLPNAQRDSAVKLDEMHQGLIFNHGNMTCLSCHNAENYDTLHLADGRALEFTESMQLCAQCHGPQYRDYTNGSHGGMNGYWDLKRGTRTRNHCVSCHDMHSPAYPMVMPEPPPLNAVPPHAHAHQADHPSAHKQEHVNDKTQENLRVLREGAVK